MIYAIHAVLQTCSIQVDWSQQFQQQLSNRTAVTFTDNKLNGYEGGDAKGGAIYAFNAILTLNGTVSFTNNEANTSFEVGGTGGAVYLYNSLNPFIYCTEVEKCSTK